MSSMIKQHYLSSAIHKKVNVVVVDVWYVCEYVYEEPLVRSVFIRDENENIREYMRIYDTRIREKNIFVYIINGHRDNILSE